MTKTRRNRPCPCGSGKKYKLCCLADVPENCPVCL
ncbi:SEC-C metal-binding domain-containing protein [Planctomycetota bacterium]